MSNGHEKAQDGRVVELLHLRDANEQREERLHAQRLCTHSELPALKFDVFMDQALEALGIERLDYELEIERRRRDRYDHLESEIVRRTLTGN